MSVLLTRSSYSAQRKFAQNSPNFSLNARYDPVCCHISDIFIEFGSRANHILLFGKFLLLKYFYGWPKPRKFIAQNVCLFICLCESRSVDGLDHEDIST